MELLILLILTEFLSPEVLRQHYYATHRSRFYVTIIVHVLLSIWLWLLYFKISTYNSFFDTPSNIWRLMAFNGTIAAVVFPRLVLIIFHFSGKLIKIKTGGHIRWLTDAGLIIMTCIFFAAVAGNLRGRFNVKTENVTIPIEGLHPDLEGLRIAQISDLHLATFNHHLKKLEEVVETVNSLNPDLVINTGDFVTFGWREFDRCDTILAKIKSRYGAYAILGNHDFGQYNHEFSEADKRNNVLIIKNKIRDSGYHLLYEESSTLKIGEAELALIGVITRGSHPNIIHGDLKKSMAGTESSDLRILLSHDPNHWEEAVTGKTGIELTLSGHTHGGQLGIITKNFRWSPIKYFYPHWNGLFEQGNQFQYVNRGLGVLGIPFRIWMPPEITLITLINKQTY
jgi:uncharacterized protein